MRKTVILFVFVLLCATFSFAQNMSALFSYATFGNPNNSPYIETYISFDAWNLKFVPTSDGKFQATVELTIITRRDDSIVYVKKYDLKSPVIDKEENNNFSFMDVHRFSLPDGIYDLQILMKDKNTSTDPIEITEKFILYYPKDKPSISSLQLIASVKPTVQENMISRNGYDMEPYIEEFIPKEIDRLKFYYEIYNLPQEISENDTFMTVAYVEVRETGRRMNATIRGSREVSKQIIPVFTTLDISQLPSGNYNLVAEIRNKNNETLLIKKFPFQRSNPNLSIATDDMFAYSGTFVENITDEKELNYYIDALYPTASAIEKEFIYNDIKQASLQEKQAFFYKFWFTRSDNPENEWKKYHEWLKFVDANYSLPRRLGYKSDRGRVYLQYGPPTFVLDEKNKVSTRNLKDQGHIYYYPYQIWRYDYIPGDDVRRSFVFFDEFRSADYKLLHSNAKGEAQDMFWERRLSGGQLEEWVEGEAKKQFERGY